MPNDRFCIIADFDKICREVEGFSEKPFGYGRVKANDIIF